MGRIGAGLLIGLLSLNSHAELYPYLEIGIGYKFQEPDSVIVNNLHYDMNFGGRDSAIIEAGFEWEKFSFGIKHDSQWSTGWPFNDKDEYYKTEIFLKYKIGGKN